MNAPAQLHRYVREVLALRTNRKFTERQLFDGVEALAPDTLRIPEFLEAVEFNQARGFIDRERDAKLEEDVFFLTKAGLKMEGLK